MKAVQTSGRIYTIAKYNSNDISAAAKSSNTPSKFISLYCCAFRLIVSHILHLKYAQQCGNIELVLWVQFGKYRLLFIAVAIVDDYF